jgi:N-alpha-acetyltransferase 30
MSQNASTSASTRAKVEAFAAAGKTQSKPLTVAPMAPTLPPSPPNIEHLQYTNEREKEFLPQIRALITRDLSEPYSIYVYRYFLHQWPSLCFMALDRDISPTKVAGVVICKLETHRSGPMRGYIAMLATDIPYRGQGIATMLVCKAIDLMIELNADEIALETEETNSSAIRLYEKLGFLRSKKLHRYYLNGNSAYRLILYLKAGVATIPTDYYSPYDDMPPSATEEPWAGGRYPESLMGSGII